MEATLTIATRILTALARCNESLIRLAQEVRRKEGVLQVSQRLECRDYRTGPMLEGYVDAELRNGKGLSWWLQAAWDQEELTIEASVSVVSEQGQDTLSERPQVHITSVEEFEIELQRAVEWLGQFIDIAALSE